jgi:hypothetical protein
MDRSTLSRDLLIVSTRTLKWFAICGATAFAILTLSVRDDRFAWLTPVGFLGSAVTLPVLVKTTGHELNQRFGHAFTALATATGVGTRLVGVIAFPLTVQRRSLHAVCVGAPLAHSQPPSREVW